MSQDRPATADPASGGGPVAGRAEIRDAYDVEKLAPEYQQLLDPAHPLPANVGFYPSRPGWLRLFGTIAGIIVLLACAACAIFGNAKINEGRNTADDNTLLTVGGFFLIASLAAGVAARAQFRQLRARAAGRTLRYGLFLAPDALILRNSIGYTFLPRERITGTRLEGLDAQVLYTTNQGKGYHLTLFRPLGELDGPQLLAVVRQWLGATGG